MTDDRSILITGCSSGIGYNVAHWLAKRGWRVFATCRQDADVARLSAEGLESFKLDLSDEASVAAGASTALERTDGKLFALYNNGAFAQPGAAEDLPRAAWRAVFETNFFGQIDLTNQIMPATRCLALRRRRSAAPIARANLRLSLGATRCALRTTTPISR